MVMEENYAQALSTDEMRYEMVLWLSDWGFTLADIRVPTLLWHGELDRTVPIAHGWRLREALPDCRATFISGAGHYLVFDQWESILSGLVTARS